MANPVQSYPATKILLDHTEEYAKSALASSNKSDQDPSARATPFSQSSGPTIVNNYYDYSDHSWNTWHFGSSEPRARTVHASGSSSSSRSSHSSRSDSAKSKEDEENDDAARAALWLCAACMAAAVFVGSCVVLGGNAKDQKRADQTIRQIETDRQAAYAENTNDAIEPVVHHAKKIAETSRNQTRGSMLLNGAILLSSVVCFGSALAAYETVGQEVARSLPEVLPMVVAFSSPLVFKVGAAAGLITGAAKLIRDGYNEVNTTAKEHAMHALEAIKKARTSLKV